MDLQAHSKNIEGVVNSWLNSGSELLQKAIKQTTGEGLFSIEDINFQLEVFKENLKNGQIHEWVNHSVLKSEHAVQGKKVLCLHAGNLPLVGFQTALAIILSGADYHGKLSRKDPYLLASFLEEVQKLRSGQTIEYSTDLRHFKDLQADKVVFAGSQESVPEVKNEVATIKVAKKEASYIIRTAKFSMAYLSEWNLQIKEELVEAMLRYGGKGCRSVAVVVAEFGLLEIREELEEAIHSFWKENPQHLKPSPDLKYLMAYNKAVDRGQLWLQDFLIQETDELSDTDFTVNWVKGDLEKVRELRMKFGELVQSVYTDGPKIEGLKTELLSSAQKPPIWWKPDGVDVIEALTKKER